MTSPPSIDPLRPLADLDSSDEQRRTVPAAELEAICRQVARLDIDTVRPHDGIPWADSELPLRVVREAFGRLSIGSEGGGTPLTTYRCWNGAHCDAWTLAFGGAGFPADSIFHPEAAWEPDAARPILTLPAAADMVRPDGSPESLIEAALLKLEFAELGTRGLQIPWRAHRIIDTDPLTEDGPDAWSVLGDLPDRWDPEVRIREDDDAVVRLWTVCSVGATRVFEHHFAFSAPRAGCVAGLRSSGRRTLAIRGAGPLPLDEPLTWFADVCSLRGHR